MIAIHHIVSPELGGHAKLLRRHPKEQAFTFVFGDVEPPRPPARPGYGEDLFGISPRLSRH
jgi:hypothetical protein